ncbi:FAD-dependent thymidylate synthase [Geobacillus stearothermophilus]|nr:FAD-dependent thymidylate synthase [Geobacillus stearothermophilus]
MNVKLLAHTQLSEEFYDTFDEYDDIFRYYGNKLDKMGVTDGQAVALTAIRTCYSANKPTEILKKEGDKYFNRPATDGKGGTDADRLFRHIVSSGHLSTLEHLSFTFAIEGVSRALLAQLTRHRVGFSFSVQSQRYVRFGSDDKTGGFDYVVPPSVERNDHARREYELAMIEIQNLYDELRFLGVPPEDARFVLPQSATCNLVLTANLRALLDFYSKRRKGRGAQWEIAELAEKLRAAVVAVEPWTDAFFEQA